MIKNNIEVISLIYKSLDYLHFIADQLKSDLCNVPGWDVGVRIIANDATEEVLDVLSTLDIPYTVYNAPDPNEFYLNRVYRAYNYGGQTSTYDNLCFVNSDFGFCRWWLANLLKHHDGINIPCGRLIESGKMDSGMYGINLLTYLGNNFGVDPTTFQWKDWMAFSESIKDDITKPGGLFGPCVISKERFIESGMYPIGNAFFGRQGVEFGHPNDRPVYKSADDYYFNDILGVQFGMQHITVFDAPISHFIEGERDS